MLSGNKAIDRLTERQKECLRLVRRGRDSKTIARELGISHHTVNKAIEAAMATLGAADRFKAAEIFRLAEGRDEYEPFVYEPLGVASDPEPGHESTPEAANLWRISLERQPGQEYLRDSIGWPDRPFGSRFGPLPDEDGSKHNDLPPARRLQLIAVYAFAIVIGLALLLVMTDSLLRILTRLLL